MKKIYSFVLASAIGFSIASADCQIDLQVLTPSGSDVPEATAKALASRLTTAAAASGAVSANAGSPFYLTARFDHLNTGVLPGPPKQNTLTTELTLLIGNMETETVIASTTMTLKGVGNSDQKAFLNAMRGINANNATLRNFIASGRDKIVEYYNTATPQLLARADKAASLGDYAQALFLVSQVPECSEAYSSALPAVKKYYSLYADREGEMLLKKANTLWAADQSAAGAERAAAFLAQIPVGSKYEDDADALLKEISAQLKDDHKFETRQKYQDALDLDKRRIDAAKQVGTAWGNGQKSNTTIIPGVR